MFITLNAEAYGGAEVKETCAEMQRLADLLNCVISLDFNGVKCSAVPGGDAEKLAQRQQDKQASKDAFKFASSRP